MSEGDMQRMATSVAKAVAMELDGRRSIDETTHQKQHNYIGIKMEKDKKWAEFWDALTKHIVKWGIIGAISVIGYALWYYIKHLINNGN